MTVKKRTILLLSALLLTSAGAGAQEVLKSGRTTPRVAIKSNLLYDATTTINLGAEIRLGHRATLDLPFSYNPWTFDNNKKLKHFLAQPEVRFWFCEAFDGHFWGIHGHYAYYNIGGVGPFTTIKNNRYEGWLAGAGVSYGYHWILGNRFSMEFTLGVGYAYVDYEKYGCQRCDPMLESGKKHYFGPTKAGVTLIFMIK